MFGDDLNEVVFFAEEGGGEPVGDGAAEVADGVAAGDAVFEEDAVAGELEADAGDFAGVAPEAVCDVGAELCLGLAGFGA